LGQRGGVGSFGGPAVGSPPALAFQQGDWVVVGDLNNFTNDARLDDALDTALRVELEQSRYVNVISELKVDEAMRRMGRSANANIDRAVGSEIALREGARALLLPSVAEVGGKLGVSIEVVDPNTQTTVYAQSAEGRGIGSALGSLDEVTSDLREALGESMSSIQSNDKPLAQVTTANLDALRAYSLAQDAVRGSHHKDALALYQQALKLDPKFAMASIGVARVHARNGDFPAARHAVAQASANRDRLTEREAMEFDAFVARFDSPQAAMQANKTWATLYPDSYRAYYNYSIAALEDGEYARGLSFLAPALNPKNPSQANAWYLQGVLLLAQNRFPEAKTAFQRAETMGVGGDKLEFAELYAAQRDFAGAERALGSQTRSGLVAADERLGLDDPNLLFDQGKLEAGKAALSKLREQFNASVPGQANALRGTELAIDDYLGRLQPAQWKQYIEQQSELMAGKGLDENSQSVFSLLAAGAVAARHGDVESALGALNATREVMKHRKDNAWVGMRSILEAELALHDKQPAKAISLLLPNHDGTELYYSHAVLMRSYLQAMDYPAAMTEAEWLMRERGRAYAEWNSWDMWTGPNVIESNLAQLASAEIALKLGNKSLAKERLQGFLGNWPDAERGPFAARVRAIKQGLETQASGS